MAKIVLTTTDTEESARSMARKIVEGRRAACVSIIRNVLSAYRWEGSVSEDGELMLVCKTSDDVVGSLTDFIGEIHGYDVPEILVLNVEGGSAEYLKWVDESCRA